MKKLGKTYPRHIPIGYTDTASATATTRSLEPNQSAASLAGADEPIGIPKAVIN